MPGDRRTGRAFHRGRGHPRSGAFVRPERIEIPTLVQLADSLSAQRKAGDTQSSIVAFLQAVVEPHLKVVTENVSLGGLSVEQTARLRARVVATGPFAESADSAAESTGSAADSAVGSVTSPTADFAKESAPDFTEALAEQEPPQAASQDPTPQEAASALLATQGKSKKKRRGRGVPLSLQPERAPRSADASADALRVYGGGRASIAMRVMVCRHGTRVSSHIPRTELMHHSCVVFDALSWEVISVAPRTFSDHVPRDLPVTDDYIIARAEDGTLCTLYRWENPLEEPEFGSTWCISTGRGYDVSGIQCLFSEKSWAATLLETMQRVKDSAPGSLPQEDRLSIADEYGVRLVEDFRGVERIAMGDSTGSQGLEFCHTISFRNHDLHPLLHDPEDMWCVQSVPLTEGAAEFRSPLPGWEPGNGRLQPCGSVGLLGIKQQVTYSADELADIVRKRGIADPTTDRPLRLSDLRMMMETAKEDAEMVIKVSDSVSAEFGVGVDVRDKLEYGYVLRSRDVSITRENSDIIIETPLLSAVRAFMYHTPRTDEGEEDSATFGRRHTYNAVRAILMPPEKRDSFLALFPQYRELAGRCDEFLRNVSHYVLTRARKDAAAGAPPTGDPSSVHVVGDAVLAAVRRETGGRFDPQAEGAEAMVRGFLYTTSNTVVTMQALRL